MRCPQCSRRKARRACPALGQRICTVCCGTKRLVEIACPNDCSFLNTARNHPPAVVQKRQERDTNFLGIIIQTFTQQQYQIFLFLLFTVHRYRSKSSVRLLDEDIAEATNALAATLETASKGIIYEHRPTSLPAQDLTAELAKALKDLSERAERSLDGDSAIALRGLKRAASDAPKALSEGETSCLDWLERLASNFEVTPQHGTTTPNQTPELISPPDQQGPKLILP